MGLKFTFQCFILAAAVLCAVTAHAGAQSHIKARYSIAMTGVPIGQIAWLIDIGDARYTTSAHGKASGVLSVLVKGEGSIVTHGAIADGVLHPGYFTSDVIDEDGNNALRMTFDGPDVKELLAPPDTSSKEGMVAITASDLRGVVDPLTAVLIPGGDEPLSAPSCERALPIFDGRHRYNLLLSFKRIDTVTIENGYSGKVLVCNVELQPVAGYRADSVLVKYVARRRGLELWFAPVAGTGVIAPVRIVVPTLLGTLEIKADQFVASVSAPSQIPEPR